MSDPDPVRAAFDKFDADGSGKLERGELMRVFGALGLDVLDEEFVSYAKALMEDYDADENGTLDFQEFTKMYTQCLESETTRKAYAEELQGAVGGLVGDAVSGILEQEKQQAEYEAVDTSVAEIVDALSEEDADEADDLEEQQTAAALKIQAVHRGKAARKEIQARKEQTAAAVKIQAAHRGKQARKELHTQKEEPDDEGPEESDDGEAVESLLVDLVDISCVSEANVETDDLETQAAAAVKIQAAHRGKQARKELSQRVPPQVAAPPRAQETPDARPKETPPLETPSTSDPVRVAFAKFDADGSGKLERHELMGVFCELGLDVTDGEFVSYAKALMEDYDADENGEFDFSEFSKMHAQCLETEATRKAYAEELQGAVGGLVSGAVSAILDEEKEQTAAALKIQTVHRGKAARRELQKQKEELDDEQPEESDGDAVDTSVAEIVNALSEEGADFDDDLEAQTAAAVKIQAVHRGKQARKELQKQKDEQPEESDGGAVDTSVAEIVDALSASEDDAEADDALETQAAAALKIQAVHRGKRARRELQTQKEQIAATVKIQAVHRGKQARKEVQETREQTAAAVKIQAVHRGKAARLELQTQWEQTAAALTIQAVHRGKQTRKDHLGQREEQAKQAAAALKIQAAHRGKQTRVELRKERERAAVFAPATDLRESNKTAPAPVEDPEVYSEDENYETNAVRAATRLVSANPRLADALEAAAVVSNRRSTAFASPKKGSTRTSTGGLSRHMVNDLAKRLPSLCGGGRGGEMEALKLIAAVVATRRNTNKGTPT
jgi:Ca2+-binding EF-hand superfamily protein